MRIYDRHVYRDAHSCTHLSSLPCLGMPYAFYEGGYVLTPLILLFVTLFALITAVWLVDVAHRARHIVQQKQQVREDDSCAS